MIGKGATPSFFAIANDNYTLTFQTIIFSALITNNYNNQFLYNLY